MLSRGLTYAEATGVADASPTAPKKPLCLTAHGTGRLEPVELTDPRPDVSSVPVSVELVLEQM
jgi:hypothetical protein